MRTNQKTFIRLFCLVMAMLFSRAVYAQVSTVTGTVTDPQQEPLTGVVVTEKGNPANGVITDIDGKYSIKVPAQGTLVFTYTGFSGQDVDVAGRSLIDVTMSEDLQSLEEVVVIGYGTMRRKDLTGAVASVKGDDLVANPVSNVAQALQGRLPGVNVVSQDGRPGASVSVRVRGGGSITQSNEPLYVVDGFPVGNIDNIAASEIESIDVLKDAASTAIYGARGANGVILVTTKGGQEGKAKVTYEGYVQFKNVAKKQDVLSAQEYVLDNWSYATTRGSGPKEAVEKYFGLGSKYGNHYAEYANVAAHQYDNDILRTGFSHNHNLNITGGSENTRMAFNIGYIDDEGIRINSDYDRFTTSLKIQQKLFSNLTFNAEARYDESTLNGAGARYTSGAYHYKPIDNPLGGVSASEISGLGFGIKNIDDSHNPVELINDITSETFYRNFRGNAALTWEIISGLTARSEIAMTRGSSRNTYYENGYTNGDKRANISRGTSKGLRWVTTANYMFDVKDIHSFNILAGYELLRSENESMYAEGRGFPDTFDYDHAIAMMHTATYNSSFYNTFGVPDRTVSWFGRFNYTLLDRYLFTATFRADGSSKFAPNNRWGYFPAVAAGWRISEENFMEGTRDWLSNLKLRLSWGESGSDNINSNLWRETWSSSTNNKLPINGEFGPFYRPDGLKANPDLKWETTVSRNLGVDFGFLNSRINGAVEVYWNTTKDLLMLVPVDNTSGYSHQYQNFGQISNRGVEISVNADIYRNKDFRFSAGAIYNYNRNNLDKMQNADQYIYSSYWGSSAQTPAMDWMLAVDQPIGIVRGYIADGFYTTADFNYSDGTYTLKDGVPDLTKDITATYMHPFTLPNGQVAFPGAPKFRDTDDNGKIDAKDAVNLGEVRPRHTGSFHLDFGYKGWDLSANFNWTYGGKVYNANAMMDASGNEYDGLTRQYGAWRADCYRVYDVDKSGELYAVTEPGALNALNANASSALPYHQSGIVSSEFLEDGSYLRLQTLTLGYTLPQQLTRKAHISNFRLYVTAGNLFTITGYSGLDPEVNTNTAGTVGFGSNICNFPMFNMDYGTYPRARTWTIGASLSF
jgi:TonB-linked SusC/RagA family outer membrane protein